MKRSRNALPARSSLGPLAFLLGLLLAAMIGGTLYFQHLYSQDPLLGASGFDAPSGQGAPSGTLGDVLEVFSREPEHIGGTGSRIVNILLVGQDRLEGESRTRSDSMILCTFNKRTRELILTSFLRDLYVTIPGYGGDRINAAYAYGGMELLESTLKENFDLEIDGIVEVDFSRFSQIVDRLGGVDMELRADEAALISQETGTTLSEGLQHLNGDQALSYARIRKLDADGDFSRTSRQRLVLSALLDAYKDASLSTLLLLTRDLLPMISTDLNIAEITGYALELFPLLSGFELRQQHIPAEGAYTDQNINGMAVLVPDLNKAQELLSRTLLGS